MRKLFLTAALFLILALSLGTPSSILAQTEPPATPEQPEASPGTTRYLTIPAAAFQPAAEDYDYQIHGRYLKHYGQAGQNVAGTYFAPVQLPQGARITALKNFWMDPGPPGVIAAVLYRSLRWTDTVQIVAGVPPSNDTFAPSFGYSVTYPNFFSIDEPINNLVYNYYIDLSISGGGQVWACAFQIEYTEGAQTSYNSSITIPPAAFTPFSDGHDYYNNGWNLDSFWGPAFPPGRGWYFAPVNLPDGATITGLDFHWKRNMTTSKTANAVLYRTYLSDDNYEFMASASSTAGSGALIGSTYTNAISNPYALNLLFGYFLILDIQGGNPVEVNAREVVIQYSLPTPYLNILAIPAAAFQPYEDGYDYENHGRHINHKHGPGDSFTNGWYMAPVNLPDGAIIDQMDFHWFENSGVAGVVRLQRTELNVGNFQELATIFTSTGTNTGGVGYDTSVTGGPIDNSRYAYWLVVDIPASAGTNNLVLPIQMRLNYSLPIYLPLVWR